jgi:hypothetical protein
MVHQIPIVAHFPRVKDTVATVREGAIRPTESTRCIGIPRPCIALFARIHLSVAAELEDELAVIITGEAFRRHRGLAFLSEGALNDAIPTEASHEEARSGTGIAWRAVPRAFVTFLSGIHNAIPTLRCPRDNGTLDAAAVITAITVSHIAVITLLSRLKDAISAQRQSSNNFPSACATAPISVARIAVIALLTRLEESVAAGRYRV